VLVTNIVFLFFFQYNYESCVLIGDINNTIYFTFVEVRLKLMINMEQKN